MSCTVHTAEGMHNQREDLQRKLQESQRLRIEIETKCQDLESQLDAQSVIQLPPSNGPDEVAEPNGPNRSSHPMVISTPEQVTLIEDEESRRPRSDAMMSMEDLAVIFKLSRRLQPIDAMITDFVSKWQFNSQVFRMTEDDDIKENERESAGADRYERICETCENVKMEIASIKEEHSGNGKEESNGKIRDLVMELILDKIVMLKHVGTVHMKRGQKMSQIMYLAQQRIVSLQRDLMKKNREMEIHLKVKEKMYDEVKSVQSKVENLSREYQIVVRELENLRGGRADSIDSSFSH